MKSLLRVQKRVLGIDIADHTLCLVDLVKSSSRTLIAGSIQTRIPQGVVVRGRIRDEEKLKEIFQKAILDMKQKAGSARIGVFGLPESRMYVHLFSVADHSEESLRQLIEKEALETFPLNHSDMVLSWRIMSTATKKNDVLLLATHRETLKEWHLFFTKVGISVPVYDSEILALFRGLSPELTKGAICLVDIGAVTTTISIFDDNGILHYIYSFEGAGDALTEQIAKTTNMSFESAEKLKITIDAGNPPSNLSGVLPSFFDRICQEIKISIDDFQKEKSRTIQRVVLVGGSSSMKGLPEHISKALLLPVLRASAVAGIEAIGLALRLMSKNHIEKDPFFKNPTEQELKTINAPDEQKSKGGSNVSNFERSQEFEDVQGEKKELRKNSIIFFFVIVVGITALAGALWYQDKSQKKKEEQLRLLSTNYSYVEKLGMSVPLTFSTRLYRFQVPAQPIADFVYTESVESLRRQLNNTEDFWQKPINELIEPGILPISSLAYLIFDRSALRKYVKNVIDTENTQNKPYDIGEIEYISIERDAKRSLFILKIEVSISSQAPIPFSKAADVIPTTP